MQKEEINIQNKTVKVLMKTMNMRARLEVATEFFKHKTTTGI